MKYQIIINQQVLANTSLDLTDSAILDFLYFYINSPSKKIEDKRIIHEEKSWTWVNFRALLNEMPLLRIKNISSLSRRIKKLEDEGFIQTFRKEHKKLYFRLLPKIDTLLLKSNDTVALEQQNCCVRATNKDIIDKDNKDKSPKGQLSLPVDSPSVGSIAPMKDKPAVYKNIVMYFCQQVKVIHKINIQVNWKNDIPMVKSFCERNPKVNIVNLIDYFVRSKKFLEHPTISSCFSVDTLNKFLLKNKPSELDELFK